MGAGIAGGTGPGGLPDAKGCPIQARQPLQPQRFYSDPAWAKMNIP
jgi:hypothetical protein